MPRINEILAPMFPKKSSASSAVREEFIKTIAIVLWIVAMLAVRL